MATVKKLLILIAIAGTLLQLPSCSRSDEISTLSSSEVASLVSPWERLNASVNSGDVGNFSIAINELKRSGDSAYLIQMMELWDGLYPPGFENSHMTQEFLLKDRVRIELADALVQGVRNGRISGNSNAFVDFAKQKLASEDDFVTSRAILILGGDHSGNNLELILRELKKEKEGTYRAAVLALSQQCDIDAIDVENFVEALKKEEVRAFFHKTWQGLDSHRSLMCGRK